MAVPENIQLEIVVNGGEPQTGVVVVDWEDEIVLSLADPAGVKSAIYRIWEYPVGFECPDGWSTNASGYGYYAVSANGTDAPAFTLPASSATRQWGNYYFSVEVNERKRNGQTANDLFDDSAVAKIPSASGILDLGFGETNQINDARQWANALKELVRDVDAAIVAAGLTVSSDTVTATHTSSGSGYETVDALTYEIPEGYIVEVSFVADAEQAAEVATYERFAKFYRQVGEDAVLASDVPTGGMPYEVDSAWDAIINLSTNDLEFQVKANNEAPDWTVTRTVTARKLPQTP